MHRIVTIEFSKLNEHISLSSHASGISLQEQYCTEHNFFTVIIRDGFPGQIFFKILFQKIKLFWIESFKISFFNISINTVILRCFVISSGSRGSRHFFEQSLQELLLILQYLVGTEISVNLGRVELIKTEISFVDKLELSVILSVFLEISESIWGDSVTKEEFSRCCCVVEFPRLLTLFGLDTKELVAAQVRVSWV